MKRKLLLTLCPVVAAVVASLGCARADAISSAQLADHGLRPGGALQVLPAGAVVHVELHGVLPVLEGLEGILKAAVPARAAPPDLQNLLQLEHPLLTALGMQLGGQPLNEESIANQFGLAARGTVTLSLYPGDPRRLFILSLPVANRDALAMLLTMALEPEQVERVQWGDGAALRVVSAHRELPALHVVCGADRMFLCGDRALAMALHQMPTAERLDKDPFLGRVLPTVADQQLAVVCDPRLVKPAALQLQQIRPFLLAMLHQHRTELLANMPREQREAIERQFQAQWGVENLEQLADYLEAVAAVTSGKLVDFFTRQLISFEGLCFTADLDAKFPQLGLAVYSSQFQPDQGTRAIPMDEVRAALAWLGDDVSCFSVQGQKPAPTTTPVLNAWVAAVREEFASRGLPAAWFDRFGELLEAQAPVPSVESQVPWTLTVQAPVAPQPSLEESPTLVDYLNRLNLPSARAVSIVPDRNLGFLEEVYRAQTESLAQNQALGVEFARETTRRDPWLDHVWRFDAEAVEGLEGVQRLVFESAFRTHGGIFGYDQHELVNRRVYHAREIGGYLVYHQGLAAPNWLAGLRAGVEPQLPVATRKLLDQVPDSVTRVEVHRVLQNVPLFVDWLGRIEGRVRMDLDHYLARAGEIAAGETDPEAMVKALKREPMPELLYALCRNEAGDFYALLPGNVVYPRPAVVPLLSAVFEDYAEHADELGGSLCYTQVQPDMLRLSFVQSTEALATLISSVGNAVVDRYLATPEKQAAARDRVWRPGDQDPGNFDEALVINPRWDFIPRPPKKQDAHPEHPIPDRPADAGEDQIDLGSHYNASLEDSWHHGTMQNNTLENVPTGLVEFDGVTFDVRGIVQLAGTSQIAESSARFPGIVEGIEVRRTAARLHFLHACGWNAPLFTKIGVYTVHYADGQTRHIEVLYGRDVLDWWTPQDVTGSAELKVAWTGPNNSLPNGVPLSLYHTAWDSPRPDEQIESIDYASTMSSAAPFLIAITAE